METLTTQLYCQFREELAGGFGNSIIHFNGRTATDQDQLDLIAKAEGLDLSKVKAAPKAEAVNAGGEPELTPQQKAAVTKAANKAAEAEGESKKDDPAGDPTKVKADAKAEAEKVIAEGTDALKGETNPAKIKDIQAKIDSANHALKELG